MDTKKGFTLVELLVVIAIIALLMAIIVPSMRIAREHTRRIICGTNLRSIGTAMNLYAEMNNDRLPPTRYTRILSGDGGRRRPFRSYWAYSVDTSQPWGQHIYYGPYGMGNIHEAGLIDTPEIFYCASAPKVIEASPHNHWHYDGYHDDQHPWPWNTMGESPVRVSYNYVPQSGIRRDEWGYPAVATNTSELHSSLTMSTDLISTLSRLSHARGGRAGTDLVSGGGVNALFSDGSVRFCNNPEAFDPDLWDPSPHGHDDNFRAILRLLR